MFAVFALRDTSTLRVGGLGAHEAGIEELVFHVRLARFVLRVIEDVALRRLEAARSPAHSGYADAPLPSTFTLLLLTLTGSPSSTW